jgi:protein-S-isoprenylcysteine O-methyltransferase Ste14
MIVDNFYFILWIWIAFAIVIFPLLLKVTAPYGRHSRMGWGPMIPNRLGWIVMELPSLVLFGLFFWYGSNSQNIITLLFFLLYTLHYTNRSLIFPLRTRTSHKRMPLIIAVLAIVFNTVNGSLNGIYFGSIADGYGLDWVYDIRFILGSILFLSGAFINISADNILLTLRNNSSNGYAIPEGRLFKYVSCPNFFGEILEWFGFAIMTWSPAALAFAVWSLVNLIPRALDHHRWYKEKFSDYPSERKAVIPYIL